MNTLSSVKAFSTALLRTPLLSLSSLDGIDKDALIAYFKQPTQQNSLYVASPALYEAFIKYVEKGGLSEKDEKRLILSLARYFARMTTRSTPFGLFSACSVSEWQENAAQIPHIRKEVLPVARFDMTFLCNLIVKIEGQETVQPLLLFYPNTGIYQVGDRLRYFEYTVTNKYRSHKISAVMASDYLLPLLELAKSGATLSTLAQTLVNSEITFEEAYAFTQELVTSQLLVSELSPAVTGDNALIQLIEKLQKISDRNANEYISNLLIDLHKINGIFNSIANSDELRTKLQEIETIVKTFEVEYDNQQLYQVDTYRDVAEKQISDTLTEEIKKGWQVLETLFYNPQARNANLNNFANKFTERYENAEIPLLQALDTEIGIGYPVDSASREFEPLSDEVIVGGGSTSSNLTYRENDMKWFKKYQQAAVDKIYEWEMTEEDLKDLKPADYPNPPSYNVTYNALVKVFKQSEGESPLIYMNWIDSRNASAWIGRFCHISKDLNQFAVDFGKKEQSMNPNVVLAEIVHLPEARVGNILYRPALREYEIPFLAQASVDKEHQIDLEDLYITNRGGRVVLLSKRLNKQIVPKLTNAHNYMASSIPIYRLLCDLQGQEDNTSINFSWGAFGSVMQFQPRVRYKNFIFSVATWHLDKVYFKELLGEDPERVNKWRAKWQIPAEIVLSDGDNELYVNFENPLLTEMFLDELAGREQITLKEFLFSKNEAYVKDEAGNGYSNEVIATFYQPEPATARASQTLKLKDTKRKYIPGDDWVYFKIYTGSQTADKVLAELVRPIAGVFLENDWIDKWFFIRYNDGDGGHLRVRFHLKSMNHLGDAILFFNQHSREWVDNGLIQKIALDTYHREVERYGAETMELSEELFFLDSDTTSNMLSMIEGDEGEIVRWRYGMLWVHKILDAFQLDINAKKNFCEMMRDSFWREFGGLNPTLISLDKKFRSSRKIIDSTMVAAEEAIESMGALYELLQEVSPNLEEIVGKILAKQKESGDEAGVSRLLDSYIHMAVNRLFKSKQRLNEMVIYSNLAKYYETIIARMSKGQVINLFK